MNQVSFYLIAVGLCIVPAVGLAQDGQLKRQSSPEAVVNEHVDALNHCDLKRLMAQYPQDAQFHLPDGKVLKGPKEIRTLFEGFCKSVGEGGLAGMQIIPELTFAVGDTLNVQWRAEAPYLKEPYKGSDAYVTKDGLMQAQVTTFDTRGMHRKD
jgi:SnoaL-like domain